MYKIGYAWEPGKLKNSDYWTLDIDYVREERDALTEHGAIIQIHGDSLSACMLRAKLVCDVLNADAVHSAELFVNLMELAKVISVQRMEYKDEDDAESDS